MFFVCENCAVPKAMNIKIIVFYPEDGSCKLLLNVDTYLPNYAASLSRTFKFCVCYGDGETARIAPYVTG